MNDARSPDLLPRHPADRRDPPHEADRKAQIVADRPNHREIECRPYRYVFGWDSNHANRVSKEGGDADNEGWILVRTVRTINLSPGLGHATSMTIEVTESPVDGKSARVVRSLLDGEDRLDLENDYVVAVNAIERLIVAHVCEGVMVEDARYLSGLQTALEALGNE